MEATTEGKIKSRKNKQKNQLSTVKKTKESFVYSQIQIKIFIEDEEKILNPKNECKNIKFRAHTCNAIIVLFLL